MRFRVKYRPPLDWDGLLEFFAPRATPGVEAVRDGAYCRTIRSLAGAATLEARARHDSVEVCVRATGSRVRLSVVEGVRRIFDLDADPATIAACLRTDALLRPWSERWPGVRVPGAWDPFELTVRAILGQQVSVKAATTLAGRLVRGWGEPVPDSPANPGLTHLFPLPQALARADVASIGVPRARGRTIRDLAAAVVDGRLDLYGEADSRRVREALQELPGIGEWTVEYVALRALGEPDAFPASDLGLLRSPAAGDAPSPARLRARAEAWRPWRSYAAMLLWRAAAVNRGSQP